VFIRQLKKSKKGDIQIYSTIFVLLVFFLIMAIGLIFYLKAMKTSVINSAQEIAIDKFSLLLNTVITMPELRYSFHGSQSEALDTTKLTSFQTLLNSNKLYYQRYFGKISSIEIQQVYPQADEVLCTEKNYPQCSKWVIYSNGDKGLVYSTSILLYYPQEDKYKIGKIYIQAQ